VSHVVANREIIYVLTPGINMARQELYGVFAFLLLLPAVFGPQDRTLVRRLLRSWPVASLGVISYGIYLWHLNLIDESIKWMDWTAGAIPFWILTLLVLAVTIGFASASYFGLERPILRLKDRIGWWDPRSQSAKSDPADQPPVMEGGSDPKPMDHRGSLEP
jgi:peptidoglycan/LPS O-acetylase OafA/YrhL